jgi:hypothetical protein
MDIARVVESLEDLWDPAAPSSKFDASRRDVESFAELQPSELGHTKVEDIYPFYASLVLMYALKCAASGDPQPAISCAHALLTAMGQLDQNVANASFFDNEKERQASVLALLARGTPLTEIRDADRTVGQALAEIVLSRIK